MIYILLILCFIVGVTIGFLIKTGLDSRKDYDGIMRIIPGEDKTVFSLELADDPTPLQHNKLVIFKVDTSEEISVRE